MIKNSSLKPPCKSRILCRWGFLLLGLSVQTAFADGWDYRVSVDQVSGKDEKKASIESANSLNLPFPYKGQNTGTLLVQKQARGGLGVAFMVEKGQLMCSSYRPCTLTIVFDNKPPMQFKGNGVAGNDPTATFISDPNRFISNAKTAKRILVAVVMWQAGEQILNFATEKPLEWK